MGFSKSFENGPNTRHVLFWFLKVKIITRPYPWVVLVKNYNRPSASFRAPGGGGGMGCSTKKYTPLLEWQRETPTLNGTKFAKP